MHLRLRKTWISLKTSFWFIPTIMVMVTFVLAVVMIFLDDSLKLQLSENHPRLFGANAAGARSILAAIAGSMITVAGVTFSVTIVALSLASNQYTPRILRNFMRDTGNKVVLGVFVSVFLYCLLILRTIRGGDQEFIPSYSLAVGMGLGVVSIGFLIYFVHHISVLIQASHILASVYQETIDSINLMFPRPCSKTPAPATNQKLPKSDEATPCVRAISTGYIQDVDNAALIEWAASRQAIIEMLLGIGEFAIKDAPLLKVHGSSDISDDTVKLLNSFFSIDTHRTIEQDPAFGIRQIVDVALKALSPGINDTTTAITSLDYLGAILYHAGTREIPSNFHCKDGEVRLIARCLDFKLLADEALSQIRQHARGNTAIYLHMFTILRKASTPQLWPERRAVLAKHSNYVAAAFRENARDISDKERLETAHAATAARLETYKAAT